MDKNPVSVLYVDDEEVLLDLAKDFLERLDAFVVKRASSVSEALPLLAATSYDVIVSDYQMPETNGIEFLKLIRTSYPDIPFILFTGKGREEVVIEAINNGAAFYIQKGGDAKAQFTELAHKIRQAVSQARAEETLLKNFIALQQQERVIKEGENFYRAVFENTGTAMMVIEEDTTIRLCNAECERLSGFSRSEIEGKKRWTEFVTGEDRERMLTWHRLRRESDGGAPRNYEFTLVNRGGDRRRIFLTIDLIPGTNRSVASLIDITERIHAEEALKQSEALHRTIFEISPDPITLTDADGILVRVSPSSLRLFGLASDEEAVGKPLFDWIAPEHRDEVRAQVLAFIRGNAPLSVGKMFPLIKKDGIRFFAEINSSVIRESDGRPAGMISVLRNVTDRIVAEKAMRSESEKLGLLATVNRRDILDHLTILLGHVNQAEEEAGSGGVRDRLEKIRTVVKNIEMRVQRFPLIKETKDKEK